MDWDAWFYSTGFPPKLNFDTSLVDICYALATKWDPSTKGSETTFQPKAADIEGWTANQVVVFLERVQEFTMPLTKENVRLMGNTYGFTKSANVEVVTRYLTVGLKAQDETVYQPTADLLGKVGRMKFVRPL